MLFKCFIHNSRLLYSLYVYYLKSEHKHLISNQLERVINEITNSNLNTIDNLTNMRKQLAFITTSSAENAYGERPLT